MASSDGIRIRTVVVAAAAPIPTCRILAAAAIGCAPSPPDVGPVQGRNPSGLRFLRRLRLAKTVEDDRLENERLEGGLVNFFTFGDVDRAACASFETRVEETGRSV